MSATFLGVPLGLISLVTLTVQNSALTIVLHYSRISVPADQMYNAAAAVLLNELLKGAISLSIAFRNALQATSRNFGDYARVATDDGYDEERKRGGQGGRSDLVRAKGAAGKMLSDVFSSDCWKLSIPACLYVVQNNLQFVAASNLDVPTFQVTYNLKILTTALFSVILLRRRLSPKKWFALLFLAAGVGVVQLQSTTAAGSSSTHGSHAMDKTKGLLAVFCACMTSGLAGVYFEMVLKGSKADLWIRNVQLSFFSLVPAMCAVFAPGLSLLGGPAKPSPTEGQLIFANFGYWAWAVVLIQVFGGLITALVIRYSDNIMKGFATSLAIVLSFCAGIILFDFQVTLSFLVGTAMVVSATYLYNLPDVPRRGADGHLPTSLPSPSIGAGKSPFGAPTTSHPYSRPHSRNNSIAGSSTPATLHHPSAPLSQTSMRIATGLPHRRPGSQMAPAGSQTPEYSVSHVFPGPMTAAGGPPAGSILRASEDTPELALTHPVAEVSAQDNERSAALSGAGTGAGQVPLHPRAEDRQGTPEAADGGVNGRTTAAVSPEPFVRSRSPLQAVKRT